MQTSFSSSKAITWPPASAVWARRAVVAAAALVALAMTVATAILAKEQVGAPALVQLERSPTRAAPTAAMPVTRVVESPRVQTAGGPTPTPIPAPAASAVAPAPAGSADEAKVYPPGTRFFNGRPIRPARVIHMKVTGYSPDERSCGIYADGQTATLHSVFTNDMRLVAADTRILPFGSLVSVPGYDADRVVPVLDRGGAIKGKRLDLLFATHERARKWGVQQVPVTVWEYADGKPATNPRAVR